MTVQELIELLAAYPPELRVVVNGYEDGFDDVAQERISITRIELDRGEHWWEGRHASPRSEAGTGAQVVDALVLRRESK
ncbi:MAG: hypothetical protein F4056_00895 [Chloroflexi bacterium]|nr:hypothetical protein [Chloroflexota bacterium]